MKYKVALVTGASSGIGEAIARQLCARGVKVYAAARSTAKLQAIKRSLPPAQAKRFIPLNCDISKESSVVRAFRTIGAADSLDLVINNAGIGFSADFADYSDDQIDQVLETNLRGTIRVTRTALQQRNPKKQLQIVMVTSLAGKIGFPQLSVYGATKFALEGLTESLRVEYEGQQVQFTILRPGITDTAFFAKAGMDVYRDSVKKLNSYFSPDKVAQIFIAKLHRRADNIVVGNDKLFLAVLPFVPFRLRFKVLDFVNKL